MCPHNSKTMKTKKRINKTTKIKTTSQKPTQNKNDDAFTQHAGEDKRPASQDEEGVIDPPRQKQSMPRSF
jgi:hypothetical protein